MAYVVGLIATDGCLISDGRHLNFKSEDEQLVRTFLESLGRSAAYGRGRGRTGNTHYVAQFSDVALWRWLRSIGLTPRKSLVLGSLAVPRGFLFDCVRGLLDGDGSILNYWYDGGGKAKGRRYEGLTTRFTSASYAHIEWLRETLRDAVGIEGNLGRPSETEGCWSANYAIRESCVLLPLIYPHDSVPKLQRKWLTWQGYAERHGHPSTQLASEESPADIRRWPRRDSLGRFRTLSLREDGPLENLALAV